MDLEKDYYTTLGLRPNASATQIKQAYRSKTLVSHPDRGGSHVRMQQLNEAWTVLGDPVQRQEYDSLRSRTVGTMTAPPASPTSTRRTVTQPKPVPQDSALVRASGSLMMSAGYLLGRLVRWTIRPITGT